MKKKEDPKANKKRVVKDYENLSPELLSLMHAAYPNGFDGAMISFFDRDGKRVSAIPFETDEIYYSGDVSLDDIENAENSFSEDDNY